MVFTGTTYKKINTAQVLDVDKVRKDFPILARRVNGRPLIYLDNAATCQKPRAVVKRIVDFYTRNNSNIHRGVHALSERASGEFEAARETVRQFLNARSTREIVFTQGTTDAINLVADSFGADFLSKGDEIIVSGMEHHSNVLPWQRICARRQAALKVLPCEHNGRLRVEDLDRLITENTKLIALVYVSNVLGVRNPVEEVIRRARARGVPVLLDGAQAVAHFEVDVRALDCDFFAFSGHKLYADTGIGVLYGKEQWLRILPPYRTGGGMVQSVGPERVRYAGLPLKFEAGTMHVAGALSLEEAIHYLRKLGFDSVRAHQRRLMDYAEGRLRALDGVTVYASPSRRYGAVSFTIDGVHPYDAGLILDKLGIAVRSGTHCAEPLMRKYGVGGMVRASFALYNTRDEVDALIEGIRRVQELCGECKSTRSLQ
ncbi:MAG: SufS family cysteine desulfurase [Candidatus Omnitrophica bacterium]|nr:SufS family cysteine desulfurase [Candidatus Omnitrophota bacterium]